jgi:hypothetical protein
VEPGEVVLIPRLPVDGLNVSFVEETLAVVDILEVTSSNNTYLVEFVEVSSTTVNPPLLLP